MLLAVLYQQLCGELLQQAAFNIAATQEEALRDFAQNCFRTLCA